MILIRSFLGGFFITIFIMKIKTTLKDTYYITEYLTKILEELGFNIMHDSSRLSSSTYLTITNWRATVGRRNDDLLIRISDHDLPPSYDGKYGYYDFDLKSKYNTRNGLQGDAIPYGEFVEYIINLVAEVNKNTEVHEIDKILADKKFLDWLDNKYVRNNDNISFWGKILDLEELKTMRQIQSYIDEYLYDDELKLISDEYLEYLKS